MVPYLAHGSDEDFEVAASDGTRLFVRRWHARGNRRGTALIVHGLGEHSGRYGHVAGALNEIGIEVWAHDHRGFGNSGGDRAKIPSRNALIEDTKLIYEKIASEHAATKPILFGHSMGGAIAARAVTGDWIEPRALVLSSPALKSYMGAAVRAAVSALEFVSPNLVVPHCLPLNKISHDDEVLVESKSDPLNHALISPRITMFIIEAGEAAIRDAGKLKMPVLVQAAGDDKLVDPSGAKEFADAAPRGLCTLRIYEGLFHEIYNEREDDQAAVLADLKEWLVRVVLR